MGSNPAQAGTVIKIVRLAFRIAIVFFVGFACFLAKICNHPAGEGSAVVGNDDKIMDRYHSFHNCALFSPYQIPSLSQNYQMLP